MSYMDIATYRLVIWVNFMRKAILPRQCQDNFKLLRALCLGGSIPVIILCVNVISSWNNKTSLLI